MCYKKINSVALSDVKVGDGCYWIGSGRYYEVGISLIIGPLYLPLYLYPDYFRNTQFCCEKHKNLCTVRGG